MRFREACLSNQAYHSRIQKRYFAPPSHSFSQHSQPSKKGNELIKQGDKEKIEMEHVEKSTSTRRSNYYTYYEPDADPSLPRADRRGPIIRVYANVDPLLEEIGNVRVVDIDESFVARTLKYVCLLRGHPRLFKKMRRVTNDIGVLGTRRHQLQVDLRRELVNCTQGPFGPNECDRRAHLWVDNLADNIQRPDWDQAREDLEFARDYKTLSQAEAGLGDFAYPPSPRSVDDDG